MVVAVVVDEVGNVGRGWGRAARVAVAGIQDGALAEWEEHDVGWDVLHEQGSEALHHALIARFVKHQNVRLVVSGHMGAGMQAMLGRMGIAIYLGASGDARRAVVAAAAAVPAAERAVRPVGHE